MADNRPSYQDRPISEFRLVEVILGGGNVTSNKHVVHQTELEEFLNAFVELHHSPGVNPHVKDRVAKTAPLIGLAVYSMNPGGPFWWTTEGLGLNPSMPGARIFGNDHSPLERWVVGDEGPDLIQTAGRLRLRTLERKLQG